MRDTEPASTIAREVVGDRRGHGLVRWACRRDLSRVLDIRSVRPLYNNRANRLI